MLRTLRLRSLVLLSLFSLGCATAPKVSPVPEQTGVEALGEVRLTIVGTNDLHGWVEPRERPRGPSGESMLGGIDVFASYMNILRAQRPGSVVLVDAGDMFQGTLVVNMTEGAVVIDAYNKLGYDAAAVGNHEFDYGPEGEPVVAMTEADDPVGNLKKRISEARFPVLVGNLFDKKTQAPVQWENAKRTHLIERQGVKIGIIGMATPTTPVVTLRQNVEELDFKPLVTTAVELSKELRERGADIILLVVHAGGGCEKMGVPVPEAECTPDSELWEFYESLPPGTIDATVAGHTHQYLAHFVNGVPSIQSSSFGVAFGAIDLVYDKASRKLNTSKTKIWNPTPVCRQWFESTGGCEQGAPGPLVPATFLGERITPDAELAEHVKNNMKKVESLKNEELGPVLERPFGRSRTEGSELGDFVADIMRASIPGIEIAMTNSGGIRADLNTGPLRYGDVFAALPFENRLAEIDLTGEELLAFLRLGVSGKHGILQVSGIRLDVSTPGTKACDGSRLVNATLEDGSPIEPGRIYRTVTNDFVAGGGDGFDVLLGTLEPSRIRVRDDLAPLRESVVAHVRAHPSLTGPPTDGKGRIRFVTPRCESPVTH